MKSNDPLEVLSHPQLLRRFGDLVRSDRRCTAEMLAALAEIDHRKLWAEHACPSMFAFCVERFYMSESVTAKRIWAARTARRFPVIFEMVALGELHLSAIQQLAKHLTQDNHRALLQRAKHKSSRQIELLVAEIAPKPDVPSRLRALPRRPAPDLPGSHEGSAAHGDRIVGGDENGEDVAVPAGGAAAQAAADTSGHESLPFATVPAGTPPKASSTPNKPLVALSPRRYKLEITVDQQTHDKLRMLQDLLGHQAGGADPAVIVGRAVDLLLADTLKRKAAITTRPRRSDDCSKQKDARRTRAIPAAIRRQVWERDGGRCAFVDERGRRCRGTRAVEYHHIRAYAMGGQHEADNIALRCRAHNQFQADQDFGAMFMDRKRYSDMPRGMSAAG